MFVYLFRARWKLLCENINLNEGLLAYYKFNGNFSDSSGNNLNPFAFGNPVFGTGQNGKNNEALLFDGNDDYLIVDDNGILNVPSVSISLWFKTTRTGSPQELLSRHYFSNAANLTWVTAISDLNNNVDFGVPAPYTCGAIPPSNISDVLFSNHNATVNQWYHLVCTFGNGVQKIYINGVLKNSLNRSFKQ